MADLVEKAKWVFAKTMPHNPHWYTLRKGWDNDEDFVKLVLFIREYGYEEYYGGWPYTCLNINNMKYWTMGDTIPGTRLINRKIISGSHGYDLIAFEYDNLFVSPEDLQENEQVMAQIPDDPYQSILDIGCGTGLFLDYRESNNYLGIDPSNKMLNVFRKKHPFNDCLEAKFEDFYGQGYDLIVSLFGAASYVEPWALERIPDMLNEGGRYYLMFYKPDYHPLTYQKTNVTVDHFNGDAISILSGVQSEIGNFLVKTGQK
jgi:hypothetical protein